VDPQKGIIIQTGSTGEDNLDLLLLIY